MKAFRLIFVLGIAAALLLGVSAPARAGVSISNNNGKVRVRLNFLHKFVRYSHNFEIDTRPETGGNRRDLSAGHLYKAVFHSVREWNEINVRIDDRAETVKLIGVEMPERSESAGAARRQAADVKAFVEERLKNRFFWIQTDTQVRDRDGHVLAYIWLDEPRGNIDESDVQEEMFNAELLLEGRARAAVVPPNTAYADLFLQYEQEARGDRSWSDSTP